MTMRVYLYSRKYGLSVTNLPADHEGQITVLCQNAAGQRSRILDIEGNGTEWTMYSTLFGTMEVDDLREDLLLLRDGLHCTVHMKNDTCRLLCRDSSEKRWAVNMYRLPESGRFSIGSCQCDITCDGRFISPCHALMEVNGKKLSVKENGITDGVYVNYHSVTEAELVPGDILDLPGIRLIYTGESLAVCSFGAKMSVAPGLCPVETTMISSDDTSFNIHMLPDDEIRYDRPPRMTPAELHKEIKVEAPPAAQQQEEMPLIFSVGSSAFMSLSSVMMAVNSISTAQATGAGMGTVLPSVLMAGGMFAGSLVLPIVTRKYNEKNQGKKEQKRQEKYTEYLNLIDREIEETGKRQKEELAANYPTAEVLYTTALNREDLWSHMPFHSDFLLLRLGSACLVPDVLVTYPPHTFTMDEDIMQTALKNLENKKHYTDETPLMLSLRDVGIIGIIGDTETRMLYLKDLLTQLCTYHSYKEMKLVFIYDESESNEWEFARWLPHVWNDNNEFRAIGSTRDAMRNISAYVDAICPEDERYEEMKSACVVVLSSMLLAEQCTAVVDRMQHIHSSSMRVIALAGESDGLPKECRSVIVLENNQGVLYRDIEKFPEPVLFTMEHMPQNMRDFASAICNVKLNDLSRDSKLVDMLSLFDMLRCGNVRQLNAHERWINSNPVKTLAAPVGIDKYGTLLSLDIHQNAHGPHGLIAGMTGSGKSEFIITYLLSMAINYSPLEVGFILIDYKGGGMSDTLQHLPHVVGTIDNLSGSHGIHRALVSIKSEILHRQRVFKEVSEKHHISGMDIYKYQKLYRAGKIQEPMQHLILVSDEFAELKEQEGDFIDDLVSMARIGRSLGVHLILATQKPTGVVSPQIASNARFHVCMKVQDKGDSMEMLGRPEAALLKRTGRFYLQVGFNELFVLGQSAWSGAMFVPKQRYMEEQDTSFEMISDTGDVLASARPVNRDTGDFKSKQVDEVVTYLRSVAETYHLMPAQSWKPALPAQILLDEIEKEYLPVFTPFALDPVIGVVDDPRNQCQYPLQLDLTTNGNTIIYGFAGAGKNETIMAVIYSLCRHHTADEMCIYCLDFASETTRAFSAMPQIGDIIVAGEDEKMQNFLDMMTDEMNRRRKLLSIYGGSLEIYREEKTSDIPNILIIIQNYPAVSEMYEKLEDELYRLIREGSRFGIYFIATSQTASGIRYRLAQNFKQVLCLQMTDKMDYANTVGKTDGIEPMNRLGSGLIGGEYAKEFQIGCIHPFDTADSYKQIQTLSRQAAASWQGCKAPRIPILPEHVAVSDISVSAESISMETMPVGLEKQSMQPAVFNCVKHYIVPVLYSAVPDIPYFKILGNMLAANSNRTVYMVDLDSRLSHKGKISYNLCTTGTEICATVESIFQETVKRHNETKDAMEAGLPRPVYPELILMINDMYGLFEWLKTNEMLRDKLDAILKMGRTDFGMHVFMLQECRRVSMMSMRIWYNRLPDHDGLWLGTGLSMQSILKIDNQRRETDYGEEFGYIVQYGRARVIKLPVEE